MMGSRSKPYLAGAVLAVLGAATLAAQEVVVVLDVPSPAPPRAALAAAAGGSAGCAQAPHDGGFESAVGFLSSQNAANIAQRFVLPAAGEGATWYLDDVCLALTRNGPPGTSAFAFAVFRDEGGLPGDVLTFRRVDAELPSFPGSTVCLGDFSVSLIGLDAIHVGVSWDPQQQNVHLMMDESPGTAAQAVSLRASASGPGGLGGWSPVTAVRPAVRSAGVGITLFSSVPRFATTPLAPLEKSAASETFVALGGGSLATLGSAAAGPSAAAAGTQRLLGGVAREARLGSLVVALLVFGDPATPPPAPQSWYSFVGPRDDPAAGVFERLDLPFPAAFFLGDELTPWFGDPEHFAVPVVDHERKLLLLHVRLGGTASGVKALGGVPGPRVSADEPPPTGVIQGEVTLADGSPAAGVRLTLTSPSLHGERTAVTASDGEFIVRALPPGEYQVVFELEGFQAVNRFVRLDAGQTARLDARLAPNAVDDEITVTGDYGGLPSGQVIQSDLAWLPDGDGGSGGSLWLAVQRTDFTGTFYNRAPDRPWGLALDLGGPIVTGSNGASGFNWSVFPATEERPAFACSGFGGDPSGTTYRAKSICTDGSVFGEVTDHGERSFAGFARRDRYVSPFLTRLIDEAYDDAVLQRPSDIPDLIGFEQTGQGELVATSYSSSYEGLFVVANGRYVLRTGWPTDRAVEYDADVDPWANIFLSYIGEEENLLRETWRYRPSSRWEFSGSYSTPIDSSSDRFVPVQQEREEVSAPFSVDGVIVTDMAALGGSPAFYEFDSFEEIEQPGKRVEGQHSETRPRRVALFESRVPRPCAPGEATHCLNAKRFGLEVGWRIPDGRTGFGQAVPLTGDSGLFTFFAPDNVELFAKVLDACGPFDEFWVFSAGLTNVEYALTVTDGASGRVRHYVNPLGRQAQPNLDTAAFDTCASTAPGELPAWARDALVHRASPSVAATNGACTPGPTALCLNGGRFRVEAEWDTGADAGQGQAIELTDDTGAFWFFGADNVEVLIKVLDACVNPFDRFWVFAAGLTNVEVRLIVTDTESGERRHYRNLPGRAFVPIQDTDAFATCP